MITMKSFFLVLYIYSGSGSVAIHTVHEPYAEKACHEAGAEWKKQVGYVGKYACLPAYAVR